MTDSPHWPEPWPDIDTSLHAAHRALTEADQPTCTDGDLTALARRLSWLGDIGRWCRETADMISDEVAERMETDEVTVPGVGILRRSLGHSSAWSDDGAADRLRHDVQEAVALDVATDIATGDIDPVKRNIANHTIGLMYSVLPSFTSLLLSGRKRYKLHLGDYRTTSEYYKVALLPETDTNDLGRPT